MPTFTSSSRFARATVIAGVCAAAVLVVGLVTVPSPPHLSTDTSGNPGLVAAATPILRKAGVLDKAAVAIIDHGKVTSAEWGAGPDTTFEIGSVTKTMTGALYEDSVERGEVTPTTRLGDLLPLGNSPVARVTLDSLATHTSGLPALPPTAAVSVTLHTALNRNPYGFDRAAFLQQARQTPVGTLGKYVYSNLGMALLGQALASAAGVDYADLVRQRLLDPLGMDDTRIATGPDPHLVGHGWTSSGHAVQPWILDADAYGPAGGAHSTLRDLTAYTRALMAGTSPGVQSTTPRVDIGIAKIGAAWFTIPVKGVSGGTAIYHNGETGGYSCVIIFNRREQRGVVIVSNTAVILDRAAEQLLAEKGDR